ncbi:Transposase [Brevibacterium linens]|uniref:Transposase n=1 Tax=Brevibacterium linens TaxID=1703 RepID=A0A2H1KFM6_BRELN|nr:Transposase [Brevibacterium linens]
MSTKTHQLVDGHGLPLVSICTAGQDGDSPMLAPLLEQLQVGRRTRPDAVLGDKAYSSRANRSLLRSRKIEAVISEPSDQQGHRLRRGSRGGRPPKFDAIKYKGRNVIERGYARLKQWRGLATRYDKLAVVYRAAVVLNGVIAWLQHLSDTP